MKKKILIILLVILLLTTIIISSIYIYFNNKSTNEKTKEQKIENNTEIILAKQYNLDKLQFTDFTYEEKEDNYIGYILITNNTEEDIEVGQFEIQFKDHDNNINSVGVHAIDIINKHSVVPIYFTTKIDLSNVVSMEYKQVELNEENSENNITSQTESDR